MTTEALSTQVFCLPLERVGERYRVAYEWKSAGLELPRLDARRCRDLQSRTVQKSAVEIGGITHRVPVYVSDSKEDFDYVIVDKQWSPIEREVAVQPHYADLFKKYLDNVRTTLCYSEGILPDQKSYLWTEYLEARCLVTSRDGAGQVESSWRGLANRARLLVVGMAGAGKTTLLRRMAIGLADDSTTNETVVPVYIQLRNWTETKSIDRLVRQELAPHISDASKRIGELSKNGKLVFLIDGLDEVPVEDRADAIRDLRDFMQAHDDCRFVISSRPTAAPERLLEQFDRCDMAGLSASEMTELSATHLSRSGKDLAAFWARLESEPEVFECSSNPLLLTLIITRYVRDSLSPHFVGEGLAAMTEAFADEWDSVRGIRRSAKPTLTPKHKIALLRHLAVEFSKRNQTEMPDHECAEIVGQLAAESDASETLRELEEHTNLIVRTRNSTVRFLHRAVQDFLGSQAGESASHRPEGIDAVQQTERAWRYACWATADASRLLAGKLNGPYTIENVIRSAQALSQNLIVHRDLVRGFTLGVGWALDSLLSRARAEAEPHSENLSRKPSHRRVVAKWRAPADMASDLEQVGKLIVALHHARDGVAAKDIRERLEASTVEGTRALADVVQMDGVLSWRTEVTLGEAVLFLDAKLVVLR